MNGTSYPAATAVAVRAQQHFARHLATARDRGYADLAFEPDAEAIERIIDAAFWASLRREEGTFRASRSRSCRPHRRSSR